MIDNRINAAAEVPRSVILKPAVTLSISESVIWVAATAGVVSFLSCLRSFAIAEVEIAAAKIANTYDASVSRSASPVAGMVMARRPAHAAVGPKPAPGEREAAHSIATTAILPRWAPDRSDEIN